MQYARRYEALRRVLRGTPTSGSAVLVHRRFEQSLGRRDHHREGGGAMAVTSSVLAERACRGNGSSRAPPPPHGRARRWPRPREESPSPRPPPIFFRNARLND